MSLYAPIGELLGRVADALRPPEPLDVDEWAERHRVLPAVGSGEPGPWRNERTPYLREIMRCLSPSHPCEMVVVMAGAQLGKTETGLNFCGFVIDWTPGPMLCVQPTVNMAERWSKGRLQPSITASPALAEHIAPPRSRDSGNTILSKEFPGGIIVATGANSATGLRSMPVRYLFLDEVDGYPGDAEGEGDPVELAIARTRTFPRKKILVTSTPTEKSFSKVYRYFLSSDQRHYWVPCPVCGHEQVLRFQGLKWTDERYDEARYMCDGCGVLLEDWQKGSMLAGGEWRASAEHDGKVVGFHLPSFYSPHGWMSWADIAKLWGKAKDDPVLLKVVVNTIFAEVWDDIAAGERPRDSELLRRREEYSGAPAGVALITAGVDVQPDRVELEVVGWGRGEESWSLDYLVIEGDPTGAELWDALDEALRRRYRHPVAGAMSIEAVAVDSGYEAQKVYDFCKPRRGRRIWATKGKEGHRRIWPKPAAVANSKAKGEVYVIGVDEAKSHVYARLRKDLPGPGYCHFPMGRGPEYFEQLTSEVCRTRYYKGRPDRWWELPSGKRNEALDCRVYAYAALKGWSERHKLDRICDALEAKLRAGGGAATMAARPAAAPRAPVRGDDYWGNVGADHWDRR